MFALFVLVFVFALFVLLFTFILVFVLLVGILIYIFSAITIDRFGESKEGILYSLFRYYGEQTYIYSYHFHRFADAVENKGILYLFPILSQVETNSLDLNKYISADYFLNTFGTFVGSFLSRVGIYNCLLLAIISFFLFPFPSVRERPRDGVFSFLPSGNRLETSFLLHFLTGTG